MSFLQSQLSAFQSDASSAASRLSQKRTVGPTAVHKPSPAFSRSSTPSGVKRKQTTPPPEHIVYSQPASQGTGKHLLTQVTIATDWLKTKDKALTFDEIFRFLSIPNIDEQDKLTIHQILKSHSKVEFDPTGGPANSGGTFRFRPPHNVRSGDDLLALLQRQTTAQGIPFKELADGWPGARNEVNRLEEAGLILVTRNKKDGVAKRVWADDPTLRHEVDEEFRADWHRLKGPAEKADLRTQLMDFGLTPTSLVKAINLDGGKTEKRKRIKRGGKITNVHMVLKNYEHLRK